MWNDLAIILAMENIDIMDNMALILSIGSAAVAMMTAYITQFKRGKVVVPPIRAYRLEPLNFHAGEESYRSVRLYLMLTFMNTGATAKALSDLRVRVPITEKNQDLILEWTDEAPTLHCKYEELRFAAQPTLFPYGSMSHIYTFINRSVPEQGKLVMAVEEICQKDENKVYPAYLELRVGKNKWRRLTKLAFRHAGRIYTENDFAKINNI